MKRELKTAVLGAGWLAAIAMSAPAALLEDFNDGSLEAPPSAWKCSSFDMRPSKEQVKEGAFSLRVDYAKQSETQKWDFIEVMPAINDFRPYRFLTIWVHGRADLLVKLVDRGDFQEDLSTQTAKVAEGWTRISFDLSACRMADQAHIKKLLIFIEPGKSESVGTVYLDLLELHASDEK